MKLITKRLLIRDFTREDADAVHLYASNPLVATHTIWGPNTEKETAGFIDHVIEIQQQQARTDFEFAVVLQDTDILIGGCGIHVSEPKQGEIGYCFNPQYWRQGYAAEAAAALLAFGFQELGVHRIYAKCRLENIGSVGVMKKIGMTYEGHLRGHMWYKDKWHDSFQYSMLEHEFIGVTV